MNWYGWRSPDEKTNAIMNAGDHWCNIPLYKEEVNHASEFNWGYNGSGPAQLAYSILRTYFELVYGFSSVEAKFQAEKYHQAFKNVFVMFWNNSEWQITDTKIDIWLSDVKAGRK